LVQHTRCCWPKLVNNKLALLHVLKFPNNESFKPSGFYNLVNLFFESMYVLYHFLLSMHFSLFLTIVTNEKIFGIFFALKSFHLVWWVFFYFPFLKQKMHAGTQNKYNKPPWPYLLLFFMTYSISCSMIYYLWYLVVTCFFYFPSFQSVLCTSLKVSCFYVQFIGATMGSAELQIQTDTGLIGMPSNICCVVVEYLAGGTLKSYLIKNRRRKLAFKVVIQLVLDLARG